MAPKSSRKSASKSKTPKIDPNSSFTPEAFEKELKALASKAKDETWGKFLREQASAYLKAAALLAVAAVYSNVSQLALSPVYGSIPSSIWHPHLVMVGCFTGWASNLHLGRLLPVKLIYLLPIIAINIPLVQFYLYKASTTLAAFYGPLVTEALTLLPLLVIATSCTANTLDNADFSKLPRWLADATPGMISWGFFKLVEAGSGRLIEPQIGKSFFQTRLGLEMILGVTTALLAPSRLLIHAMPGVLHTAVLNTHVYSPIATANLNGTLNLEGWSLIDRKESLTGYISVVDSHAQGFRVLRCDHSLLGGEWIKYKGPRVAEPIYSVFAMLEAVRLVEGKNRVADHEANALVVGLGVGITPAALVAHGIDTTVVEIDPVVHEFASKYFSLPSNHTAVIEDAVSYTDRLAGSADEKRFDYIVHDVFTGGAEPIALFTLEFLENLNTLLKPNGVIAINYAGDFLLPPPRIVVQTIRQVFPTCRIFREHPRDDDNVEKENRDFTNMVIFCTKTGDKVTFRKPTKADLLESPSRDAFLLPKYEVFDADFYEGEDEGILTRNDTQKLIKYHQKSALGHWAVMRTVLPDVIWNSW